MAAYISFQPSDFINTVLYSGNGTAIGSGGNVITGVGFQPDMTWLKSRSYAYSHGLLDSVRGATELIYPNANWAGGANAESLTTWSADGFTVGSHNDANASGQTFASWNFKAGTTTGIAGSPDITPNSYSFNATSGFSIINYTGNSTSGDTFPHGLGVAPKMIIIKETTTAEDWMIYHEFLGPTKNLVLNTSAAETGNINKWNDTAPTSTLVSVGNSGETNSSGNDYIAYCFADVKGYSKMGSSTGNANADGPFSYCGFRPAFVILKSVGTGDWLMYDSKREGYNGQTDNLEPNTVDVEGTFQFDILSNGFKLRYSGGVNDSDVVYIWAAFAEFPLVSSNSKPGTAR